jgi:hypothetical protein
MMANKERKFTELFHHFKADTADIHPDVRRYNEDGVIAFGGELSYEPYDDNITVRVLFLKGISVRMALKALEEIRSYIIDRPQDYFEK